MKRLLFIVVMTLGGVSTAGARTVPAEVSLEAFANDAPGCGPSVSMCLGLDLHVVVKDSGPVQSAEWFARQLEAVNEHFAALGVGFQLNGLHRLGSRFAVVSDRRERDHLGRKAYTRGTVHVFLVEHLDDIHEPGERYGVHWRDQRFPRRHWVVVARDAPRWVLAHEIGHFFGLTHSNYPISIMNKLPRAYPPESERGFAGPEIVIMRRILRRMLRSGELVL
jgi:hypothetical protein